MKERKDDFKRRRQHLKELSDQELKAYFMELADKIVDPLLDLAYKNTSKSIERSVLLRMGFNSLQAKAIVDVLNEHNLLRKGSGQCVYLLSKKYNVDIVQAGQMIEKQDGIDDLIHHFEVQS